MLKLPVEPHDEVVAAFPWRDKVLAITRRGDVFELYVDESIAGGLLSVHVVQRS